MPRGFLLHSRPYRETSSIATFLTDTDGRVDLIARVARGSKSSKTRVLLPFSPYELAWSGKNDLKHLQYHEPAGLQSSLVGTALFCGFYLNELLYRLLPHHEPEPGLLDAYALVLQQISTGTELEPALRRFELVLLQALGFGIDFSCDVSGRPVDAAGLYRFVPESGLVSVREGASTDTCLGNGADFMAIARGEFGEGEVRRLAKSVLRSALGFYLGSRPLRSRELFST